jgi:hypothetical protein
MDLCDNSNDGRPCRDPETDEPCAQCAAALAAEGAYWRGEWKRASTEERDPERYAREMEDAGRGHLVAR